MLQRFMAAIAKIPEIDTAMACDLLREQLLKEPTEYVATCREGLAKLFPSIKTEAIVTSGNRLADYQRLVDEREIDMLVFNTKDDDQLAMHGLAYPLAVEMVRTPLLLL